jgi:hypothetical protein
MSKQIDLKKLENKLREKINSLRYFLIPFEHFKKEIMSVLREFNIESDYCSYFVNYGETIVEDEHRDYTIRYEIATDELSCEEISGIIKMKRLIYRSDDIDPDVRIDVLDVLNIYLDIDYEDEEDDDYIEDEDFDEDVEDYYEEYDDEDVSDYYMDLLDSQYEDIFNRYDDIIVIDDP